MTIEYAGDGDLVATKLLPNFFEGEVLGGFGFEKGIRLHREPVAKRGLWTATGQKKPIRMEKG